MPAEKALALVLRAVEWSESSLIVTLFTREFGKIRAVAKGARRPKSPLESALDLLSVARVVFLRKSTESLDILTEARLERRFRPPGRDETRLLAAYYVDELLDAFTTDDDPHPELFDRTLECLACLSSEEVPVTNVLLWYELRVLDECGHLPALTSCAECGAELAGRARVAFGLLSGGALCEKCRVNKRQIVSVRGTVLECLSRFAAAGDAWRGEPLPSKTLGELRGVFNRFLYNVLGRRPRMKEFLPGW